MFTHLTGCKASLQNLTMVVVSEFDEWHVVVHSPEVVLLGQRQYNEVQAKEHAVALAKQYLQEANREAPTGPSEPDWQPTGPADWLRWAV